MTTIDAYAFISECNSTPPDSFFLPVFGHSTLFRELQNQSEQPDELDSGQTDVG